MFWGLLQRDHSLNLASRPKGRRCGPLGLAATRPGDRSRLIGSLEGGVVIKPVGSARLPGKHLFLDKGFSGDLKEYTNHRLGREWSL